MSSSFDLQEEWRNACREFINATGIDLNVRSPTAEQITTKLDKYNEAKEAKSQSKVGKAKRAVGKTMRAIQTIGGLLAEGASLAGFGGPANITMNCVSFFIDAGFAYQKIAENIDDLFSRISPIMERAEVYIKDREVLGSEMELTAHRMLMAVVKTCQHCIRILRPAHSKRFKVQQFFEVALFHSDQGVQEQIDTLTTLGELEIKMAGAVTVTTVKRTAIEIKVVEADVKNVGAGVSLINEKLSKSDAAAVEEDMRLDFKTRLGVDDSLMMALRSEFRMRRERLKSDTCAWLRGNSQYTLWSDTQKKPPPVLILSGDEGTGKSYAMTSIIQDLERRYPQGRDDSTRISVAYFYFTRNAQSSESGQRESRGAKVVPSVKEMLRTWACQVMENDAFYRKDVYRTLREDPNFDVVDNFLQKLFLDQLPNGAVFFLLLDETHELDDEGRAELSSLFRCLSKSNANLSSFRILLTTKQSLQRELESCAPTSVAVVTLKDQNRPDIQTYVKARTDTLACFKSSSNEIQELKASVIAELPTAVHGNFILVERKLQEINACQDADSVRQIIDTMKKNGANLFDSIDKEVRACNKALSTKQIRILNALLLWVIYFPGYEYRLRELESILYVQEQHKPFQPLIKELQGPYSAFFELKQQGSDDETVQVKIKSSAHAEYFKEVSKQRMSTEMSSDQPLSKGQIQIVQHFVQKLCEHDLYNKLGLAEFFDQKLTQSDISISVDCDNAQAKITLGCLQALAGDLGDKAESLRYWAICNMTEHLKQVDLDLTDPSIKSEMGPLIVKMFTNEQIVRDYNWSYRRSWAYNDVGLTEMVRLLKSSAVIKNVVRDDKVGEAWINKIIRSKTPEVELLDSQKQAMAKEWEEQQYPPSMWYVFQWWIGYHNKIEHIASQIERLKSPPGRWKFPPERLKSPPETHEDISSTTIVQIYEEGIKPFLGGTGSMAHQGKRNLGINLLQYGHVASAIELLVDVLADDPDDLIAHNSLADAYASEDKAQSTPPNWDEALRHKDLAIAQLRAGTRLHDGSEPASWLEKRIIGEKANWLQQLNRPEESRELWYDQVKNNPEDDKMRLELVRILCHCQKFDEVVALFKSMEKEVDSSTNLAATSRFLQSHAMDYSDKSCHLLMVSAFKQEERFEELKDYYRLAIREYGRGRRQMWQRTHLVGHWAPLLSKFGNAVGDREEVIELWELVMRWEQEINNRTCDSGTFLRTLCEAYLAHARAHARETGPGSSIANDMVANVKGFLKVPDQVNDKNKVSQSDIRTLLARYYRDVDDTMKAQEVVRTDMELALKLLSDDDPENDWQGHLLLANVLMSVGANDESLAAWSLIQPTQGTSHLFTSSPTTTRSSPPKPSSSDIEASENATTYAGELQGKNSTMHEETDSPYECPLLGRANTTLSLFGPLTGSCDGRCGTCWTYADDYYVCCECIDVKLDKECLEKLHAGQLELEVNVCNRRHQFLHVPPWTISNYQLVNDGKVLVGESVKETKSWLEELRRAWSLESSVDAFVST